MKKVYLWLFLFLCTVLMTSCASSKRVPPPPVRDPNYPQFYYEPPVQKDMMLGIGSAKLSTLRLSLDMADSRARQDISLQLNTTIKAVIVNYTREAGTAASNDSLNFQETVGRQLSQTILTGINIVSRWTAPDGTVWILISLKKADAARQIADMIDTELNKFPGFKTMDVLRRMETQLEKIDSKPAMTLQEP